MTTMHASPRRWFLMLLGGIRLTFTYFNNVVIVLIEALVLFQYASFAAMRKQE